MAKIELNPTEIFLIGTVWAALWAGLGWWANHKLSTARDRRAREEQLEDARKERKRDFKGFMSGFRSWVERSSVSQLGDGFHEKVNLFRAETGRIRDDIAEQNKARFDEAVTALCRLTGSAVTQYEVQEPDTNYIGKNRLASAIDAVVALAE